jgi:ABC-type Mn2+/Zn2+ transport system ATPase subunit
MIAVAEPAPRKAPERVLELRDLTVELGGRRVLEEVSIWVERGEFVCLLGPNGGGKTTLLKAALGLVRPHSGALTVFGAPPDRSRAGVGYLPQRKEVPTGFPATPAELIVANLRGSWPFRVRARERDRARGVLARVGGENLLDKPLAGLSGGETQRVYLARALVNDPVLLLLDEPTAGVDARGRAAFLDLLAGISRREDLSAVLVTHSVEAVRRLAERVVYLDRRVIASGPPAEVLAASLGEGREFAGRDHAEHVPALCEKD